MTIKFCWLLILQLGFLGCFFSSFSQIQTMSTSTGDTAVATVSSKGTSTLLLPVKKWGRYSIRASGTQPVAISVADKRNGIFCSDGEAGLRNGRIDLFLEIGEYKIIINGDPKATATSKILSLPFTNVEGHTASWLVPRKENKLSLEDMQQACFWFDISTDSTVYIEASGRNLADLKIWQNGEWIREATRRQFTVRPKAETPLSGIALSTRLQPGTYMVAAYGGSGYKWALESKEHPLYLQFGLDKIKPNTTSQMVLPPKGYVLTTIDNGVSKIVVEEPVRNRLVAETGYFTDDFSSLVTSVVDSIHAKGASNRLLLNVNQNAGAYVKITGTPGQPFSLQAIGQSQRSINSAGQYWIASLHTGNFADQIGASGCIIDSKDNRIVAMMCDTISGSLGIERRFNLLDRVTSFIWVDQDGDYTMVPGGTSFRWRMYRYFITPPENFKKPEFEEKTETLKLTKGMHILEIEPDKKGIATIMLRKSSLLGNVVKATKELLATPDSLRKWDPPRPAVQFPSVQVPQSGRYQLVINSQLPELFAGYIKKYPLNIDEPLSFTCEPLQKITVRIKLTGTRMVSVTDINNASYAFSVDNKKMDKPSELNAGEYQFEFVNESKTTKQLYLKAIPRELLISTTIPVYSQEKLSSLPKFQTLDAPSEVFTDIERNSSVTWFLNVKEPSLYKVETTGRLATTILIQDRFGNFSVSQSCNGVAKNALILPYLLSGQYRLLVSTVDQSAGRTGIAVQKCDLIDGGKIQKEYENRTSVPEFSGVRYTMNIDKKGIYTIENAGLSGNFPFRIEDQTSWPIDPVINNSTFQGTLDKGDYTVISLPSGQASRRNVRLTPVTITGKLKGKGPHLLRINEPVSMVWNDFVKKGAKDSAVEPVTFILDIPAPVRGKFTITNDFSALLYKDGKDSAITVARQTMNLAAGVYALKVHHRKNGNYVPLEIGFITSELLPGLSRTIHRKMTIAVSVGKTGVVEFASQGTLDVSAVLLDSTANVVIASNDDSYSDWNFGISKMLQPGKYFLRVESAESRFTSTTISMRALYDTLLAPLSASVNEPVSSVINLNRHIGIIELNTSEKGDIIAAHCKGKSRLGCSIERNNNGNWVAVAVKQGESPFISVPYDKKNRYRLRVWSEDNVDESVTVTYTNAEAKSVSWKNAKNGLDGKVIKTGDTYCAWFKVDLEKFAPGNFIAKQGRNGVSGIGVSVSLDTMFTVENGYRFTSSEQYAWIEMHFDNDGRFDVSLEPDVLRENRQFTVAFNGNRPSIFETETGKNQVGFCIAETDGYHPFAGVVTNNTSNVFNIRGKNVDQGHWFGNGTCAVAVLPGDNNKVVFWNAVAPLDGTTASAKVSWYNVTLQDELQKTAGAINWVAAKQTARVYKVKNESMRVTIPGGNALVFVNDQGKRIVYYVPGEDPGIQEIHAASGDLYLIALTNNAEFNIASFENDPQNNTDITVFKGYERNNLYQGSSRFHLGTANDKSFLFYRGAINGVDWVRQDGILVQNIGNGSSAGPGGYLDIHHDAGWSSLCLSKSDAIHDICVAKWGYPLQGKTIKQITKSSAVRLRASDNWIRFTITDTAHVNVSLPVSSAAILMKDTIALNYTESESSLNWDIPLVPGTYSIGVRAINGATCDGQMVNVLIRSIEILSEKKPFNGNLTPGESRLIGFDITKKSDYGIGLRMNKETVLASLFNSLGILIAQGKQQYLNLDNGRYYLRLGVPYDAEGTNCTVYLFGQEPPPDEPPENLVKWIINGAQGKRPEFSNVNQNDAIEQKPAWMRMNVSNSTGTSYSSEENTDDSSDENMDEGSEGDSEGDYDLQGDEVQYEDTDDENG
ncbi:MAG: hypothetical protein GX639_11560 [Fibrobacter sp.]|nr:hypothetical protein [Fibrobacter sp.]